MGLIAGGGMFIALIVDLTLLPALLRLARPSAERDVVGMPLARPIDAFLARHPKPVVGVAVAVGLLGLPSSSFEVDCNSGFHCFPSAELCATSPLNSCGPLRVRSHRAFCPPSGTMVKLSQIPCEPGGTRVPLGSPGAGGHLAPRFHHVFRRG